MKRGITLIETVVAVTVLTFALGGPFLLAAKSLRSAAYAREEIAAARLGEEALEVIHNMRDNNSAHNLQWVNNIASTCGGANPGCLVDIRQQTASGASNTIWLSNSLVSCAGGINSCPVYQFTDGMYGQMPTPVPAGWTDTGMKRMVTVTPLNANNEYRVDVEVDYPAGTQIRKVILHDTLMNWFPTLPI
jgi:Tfp pilus assembly protein PilV